MARFYTIDAANARIAELRPVLEKLRADRDAIAEATADLRHLRDTNGSSQHAEEVAAKEQRLRDLVRAMEQAVAQIEVWSVTLREIGTGLVDFPALVAGRPVWLCWRLDEERVGFWHEHDRGFSDRKPLAELA